jgi:kynurenine formamidase
VSVAARRTDSLNALLEDLASGEIEVVDLSHRLSGRTPMIDLPEPFENAPGFSLHAICECDERGPFYYWNSFRGSEHMGTHLDAPVHWITGRDGKDASQITGAELIGPAVVLDRVAEVERDPDYLLTVDDVRAFEDERGSLPDGGWFLFRTGWERRHADPAEYTFSDESGPHWPGITAECACWLAEEAPIRGYGTEQVGIDAGRAYEFEPMYPMHHYLLGAGKYGLASLANLHRLPSTGAVLIAAPLRIVRGSGSPCRVYALVPRG